MKTDSPHRSRPLGAFLLPLLLALAAAAVAAGDEPPIAGSPEDRGRRLVAAAVDALGGPARLSALDDWMVEGAGRENLSAELQGLSPGRPTWRDHEEKVAVRRAAGAVAWERRTPRNDRSVRWRRFIYTADATGVADWTARRGRMGAAGSGSPAPEREALMRRIPHVLLRDVGQRAVRVAAAGELTFDGAPHDLVDVELPDGVKLALAFGRNPAVLSRVVYRAVFPGLGELPVSWTWRGWRKSASAGLAPSGHKIDVGAARFQEVAYSRYESGATDAAAMM